MRTEKSSFPPTHVEVTDPAGTPPRGKLSRLYKLDVPTSPNGVPSGNAGCSRPSLASVGSSFGSSIP